MENMIDSVVFGFSIISIIITILTIAGFIYLAYLYLSGLLPVLYKIGRNLSRGKIAILADNEFKALENVIIKSGLFRERNVDKIEKNEIKSIEEYALIIVHYGSHKDIFSEIIEAKKSKSALIVYAPPSDEEIDKDIMKKINSKQNSTVVRLRGRLLNDILVSMITTGYPV